MPNFANDSDNRFLRTAPGIESSAIGAYAVTPNDSTDLTEPCRAVTINASGTISYISSVDGQTYTSDTLPAGTYAFFASRIRSTGTTATGITAWS